MNSIKIKWQQTGLLDNISENNSNEACNQFEILCKKILNREVGSVNDGRYNGTLIEEIRVKFCVV